MGIPELVGYYTAHLELLEVLWKNGFSNITDEDVKCLKIAYEGIRAFNKLIKDYF